MNLKPKMIDGVPMIDEDFAVNADEEGGEPQHGDNELDDITPEERELENNLNFILAKAEKKVSASVWSHALDNRLYINEQHRICILEEKSSLGAHGSKKVQQVEVNGLEDLNDEIDRVVQKSDLKLPDTVRVPTNKSN